ncbi:MULTISPECIES: aldolase/citrate lyase family protein [Polaromonas]|uniref:Aldolase/citrate lyase family protein n=1 Tax=Polaromonas aquatica TaxID=332657 RepID=A0ABW1U266_9BURK
MQLPLNHFKQALLQGNQQLGFWCTLSSPYGIELLAGSGFDWLLIDTEHSPSDVVGVLAQLQAVAPYPVSAVVRPAWNDPVLIKRYLDIGAQTLLLPYIQNAEEAKAAVRSIEYPSSGIRGVSALTRASRFGRVKNYAAECREQLCLLVQVETLEAIDRLESIASVKGVDGVFIGPGDLAASMGLVGQPGHTDVVSVIEKAIATIRKCGKPAGILTGDKAIARRCIELGTTFTAVGVDVGILATETTRLRESFAQSGLS